MKVESGAPTRGGKAFILSGAIQSNAASIWSADGSHDDPLNNRHPLTATFTGDYNGLLDIQASRDRGGFVNWGAVVSLGARGDTIRSLRAKLVAISRRATVCGGRSGPVIRQDR